MSDNQAYYSLNELPVTRSWAFDPTYGYLTLFVKGFDPELAMCTVLYLSK